MPGLQSVASAIATPAEQPRAVRIGRSGRELDAREQRRHRRIRRCGERVHVGVGQEGAVIDAGCAELHRELNTGARPELVAVHPQVEPGPRPAARTSRASSPSNAYGDAGSQNTSIQRAYGAAAVSIAPVTSSR